MSDAVPRAAAAAAVLLLSAHSAFGQYYPSDNYQTPAAGYTPPGTYYTPAAGLTGLTLKNALNDIIDGNTASSYDNARTRLAVLDQAPADGSGINKVILVYSHGWVGQDNNTGYIVDATWDSGTTWNREHLWPDSYGIDGSGIAYGELFNLRPAEPDVNSTRSNNYYAVVTGALPTSGSPYTVAQRAPKARLSSSAWNPPDVDKGHIARSQFYMDARFQGQGDDGETDDFNLTDTVSNINTSNSQMGLLTTLLHWNYQHGVTNYERRRNQIIFDSYQHNRNPFIDHPEYVWSVFGGGNNNSQINAGGSPNADGSSTATVNLRVIKNAAWGSGSVTINKTGTHPTTYDLTGSANVSAAANTLGPGQAFDYSTQARNISLSLTDSTAATGVKTGTVTLDNTDITTGGAGLGSADGNDTITVTGTVLDHAQPSLSSGVTVTAQGADFGYVPAGFAPRTLSFSVFNNPTGSGAALTAGMDVDGVTRTGSSLMSTNVVATNPATPLAANGSISYAVTFTPDTVAGATSADHTIAVSDENIPGATAGANLVLTTTGRTFTAATFPVNGYLYLLSGETLNTGPFSIASNVTLNPTGGSSTMNINAAQSNGSNSTLRTTNGITVNVGTDSGSAGNVPLALQAESSSVVNLNAPQHLRALTVAGGQVNASALVVADFFTHTSGKLDLKSSSMIVHNGDAAALSAKVAAGRNGGAWNGSGIVTSMTAAKSMNGLTTLAVAAASDVLGIGLSGTTTWAGETVTGADALIKYTYAGDANLSGRIDADDYFQIDRNVGSAAPSYVKGDFNYDGNINGDDYFIIDTNYISQGAPFNSASLPQGISSVPEPGAAMLLSIGSAVLLRRRRNRR